jgi:hypothetical protein
MLIDKLKKFKPVDIEELVGENDESFDSIF